MREVKTCQESNTHTHLCCRLNGMAGGRVRGGMSRGNGLKNMSPRFFSQIHCKRTSEREFKHPHRTKLFCHFFAPFIFVTVQTFVSRDFGICILSLGRQVSASCFRTQTFLNPVGAVVIALRIATAVVGKESRCPRFGVKAYTFQIKGYE